MIHTMRMLLDVTSCTCAARTTQAGRACGVVADDSHHWWFTPWGCYWTSPLSCTCAARTTQAGRACGVVADDSLHWWFTPWECHWTSPPAPARCGPRKLAKHAALLL